MLTHRPAELPSGSTSTGPHQRFTSGRGHLGLHVLLTLPDGAEPLVLRRAGKAGVALSGLARLRHPLAGPEIPAGDGVVVSFGTPAEHAFAAAVDALGGVLEGCFG